MEVHYLRVMARGSWRHFWNLIGSLNHWKYSTAVGRGFGVNPCPWLARMGLAGCVEDFGEAVRGLPNGRLDLLLQLLGHARGRCRYADGSHDGLGFSPQCGTEADAQIGRASCRERV